MKAKNANKKLVGRRCIKGILKRNPEKKLTITQMAFNTLCTMGDAMMNQIVRAAKEELASSIGSNHRVSLSRNHLIAGANRLGVASEIVEDSLSRAKDKVYDPVSMKRTALKRILAFSGGKSRVRSDAIPFIWCINLCLLEQIVDNISVDAKDPMRIKQAPIYQAVKTDSDNCLSCLREFIGEGVSFGSES